MTHLRSYHSGTEVSGNQQVNQDKEGKEVRTPGATKPTTTLQMVQSQLSGDSEKNYGIEAAMLFLETSRRSGGSKISCEDASSQ